MRCIKPNKLNSADPSTFEDDKVSGQLRAGSILEAIRIRKVGFGYRMNYDDFADAFWPVLGERVYEAGNETVEAIFAKAETLCEPDMLDIIK